MPTASSGSKRGGGAPPAPPRPRILAVGRALPEHWADQETLIAAFRGAWAGAHFNVERLEQLHRAVQVSGRYLALPLAAYRDLTSFARRNDAWIAAATDLGERAVREALRRAGLAPADVGHLVFVTTTGIATPSIDARLVNRLGLPLGVRRSPLFGLGCAGGAAGLARAADILCAHPAEVAVVLSVELCSLTLQRDDVSIPNIISSGLFGDGAAAVVLQATDREEGVLDSVLGCDAEGRATLRIRGFGCGYANQGVTYGDTLWDFDGPQIFKRAVRGMSESSAKVMAKCGVTAEQVDLCIPHQANLRIIEGVAKYAGVPMEKVMLTVQRYGNMSAATVPVALVEALEEGRIRPGATLLMPAFGAGLTFCSLLVRWGERITPIRVLNDEHAPPTKSALEMVNEIRANQDPHHRSLAGLMAPTFAEAHAG